MSTPDQFIQDAQKRMDASVEHTKTEFNTVRTGRASAALLDRVQIDYYGQQTPLKQLATINVPEPRMLTIQPFDPSSIKAIEKALLESDLGLTPSNDGKLIRLPMPQPTEERRKELVKVVRKIAEEGRIAVRNVRRDAVQHLKDLAKGEVGPDDGALAREGDRDTEILIRHAIGSSELGLLGPRRAVENEDVGRACIVRSAVSPDKGAVP